MFEHKIQKAWDNYRGDFGLSRIVLFTSFYNTFLFFLSGLAFGRFQALALSPVVISLVFYLLRPKIVWLSNLAKLFINTIPLGLTIILNYYLVGVFDASAGGVRRLDGPLASFDEITFGNPVADVILQSLQAINFPIWIFYDLMILSYMTYFLLPFYGGVLYYRSLPVKKKYKLGRYFASMILFYSINYLFYLGVPVTGPQYFLANFFTYELPLSGFEQFLYQLVQNGQTTFIDCFPSGHTGIAVLTTLWLFRMKHSHRFYMLGLTCLIIGATLSMRYHYTLDVLCAFPLTYLSFRAAYLIFPTRITPKES
ncbi:phosphatase PAP2 family protein [Bacteriovoracaceae bacterium]|nr:phosphatase PAP2 family protein [Bacteriovoracaceae bacterium]